MRYMQHLKPIWNKVLKSGIHAMSFEVADLRDLAKATVIVATILSN